MKGRGPARLAPTPPPEFCSGHGAPPLRGVRLRDDPDEPVVLHDQNAVWVVLGHQPARLFYVLIRPDRDARQTSPRA